MNFDAAFQKLLGYEGGYVNDALDPGKETAYGISKTAYPDEDIKNMTQERAKMIYARDYWLPCGADRLPAELRFDVFDAAVHSGVGQSIRWLQRAVGAEADGVLGPKTMKAVAECNAPAVHARFNGHRLIFMTQLKTWSRFSGGWAKRIAMNLLGE